MVSESRVTSDAALILVLAGVEDLPGGLAFEGLAVLVLGSSWGDFARMVLGCDPVVDVKSVPSISSSRTLERDAALRSAWDVMRVPLSTLRLAASISLVTTSDFFRRMLFVLAVFLKSAAVVAVRGGLGGARGGVGATRLGGSGTTRGSLSLSWSRGPSTSVVSGVKVDFLASREYMFSFAYVLDRVGYGKLVLDALADPREPLRSISGTTAILCDLDVCDVDEVRRRSLDERSRGRSPSMSSSLEDEERVLRDLVLRWRSRSLSLLLGLVRSRSGSFFRRRCESDELNISMTRGGVALGVTVSRDGLGRLLRRDHSSAARGAFDWVCGAGRSRGCAYQRSRPPSICSVG